MYEIRDLVYPGVREGYYQIDTNSNIYVKQTGKLRSKKNHNGYQYITCVGIHKKYVDVSVHRAMCYTFMDCDMEGMDVNHKDGNGLNNELSNLEVVTHKENIKHSIENQLAPMGERHVNSIYSDEYVENICKCFEEGYNNIETFEIVSGEIYVKAQHKKVLEFIGRVRRGERWQHISSKYKFDKKIYGSKLKRNK